MNVLFVRFVRIVATTALLAVFPAKGQVPDLSGLYWGGPGESGWGVNLARQGETYFLAWFTYDAGGEAIWLVAPRLEKAGELRFAGPMYQLRGPVFSQVPWNAGGAGVQVTEVGRAEIELTGWFVESLRFHYTLRQVTQSLDLIPQVFGPVAGCAGTAPSYQGLWWAGPAESGWGMNVNHQGHIVFATWFTYGANGEGTWIVMPRGERVEGSTAFTGPLYRTTGPAFSARPWEPSRVVATAAGSATLTFSDADHGTFAYTVDGLSQEKVISRQFPASPPTPCAKWVAASEGLADRDVHVVAVDPTNGATVYAGGPTGVYRSADAGANWSATGPIHLDDTERYRQLAWVPRQSTARSLVSHLAIDPRGGGTLYAATSSTNGNCAGFQDRLFKSTDAGGSWRVFGPTPPLGGCDAIRAMVAATPEPRALYLANGWAGDAHSPAIKSADGGASWTNLGYLELNAFAPHPNDAAIVYAGTSEHLNEYGHHPNGVLKSRDGGATWSVTALSERGISSLAIDPCNPGRLYAATLEHLGSARSSFRGILRSDDAGETWIQANGGLESWVGQYVHVQNLVVSAVHAGTLYATRSGVGVVRSLDAGNTWAAFNTGLPGAAVRSLSLSADNPEVLFAGTAAGVFKIADGRIPIGPRCTILATR